MKKIEDGVFNPALMFGIGLLPLLVVTTSLKTSLIFGALILGILILSTFLYYAFKPIILENVRIPIYAMIIFASVYFLDSLLSELLVQSYPSFHALIAIIFACSLVFYALERNKTEEKLKVGLKTSLLLGIGYLMALVILSLARELLAFNTIWGKEIFAGFSGLSFFGTSVGAMLLIVVYAFIYNSISYRVKKRRKVLVSLQNRYELYLKANAKTEQKTENIEEKQAEGGK